MFGNIELSLPIVLTILTIAELAIIASALAIYLFVRYRNLLKTGVKKSPSIATTCPRGTPSGPSLGDHLQQQIDASNNAYDSLDFNNRELLTTRIAFLQSELATLSDRSVKEEYWDNLCVRLSSIIPQPTRIKVDDDDDDEVNVIDHSDHDVLAEIPQEIASLTEEIAPSQEFVKLRGVMVKQNNAIDDMKEILLDHQEDIGPLSDILKKLENIEVSHAQINMNIDNAETENTRLQLRAPRVQHATKTSDDNESIADEQPYEPPDFDNDVADDSQLADNQAKVNLLERDLSEKEHVIHSLEFEIKNLEDQLANHPTSVDDPPPEYVDPFADSEDIEVLTHQIEDLTDLLVQKSERLADVQSGPPTMGDPPVVDNVFDNPMAAIEDNDLQQGAEEDYQSEETEDILGVSGLDNLELDSDEAILNDIDNLSIDNTISLEEELNQIDETGIPIVNNQVVQSNDEIDEPPIANSN